MKYLYLLLSIGLLYSPTQAEESNCERYLQVELSQSRFSLDPFEHMKDAMNSVTFILPGSCKFYDEVQVGDQLLKSRFRAGSLIVSGSIGNWNLKVKQKYERSPK